MKCINCESNIKMAKGTLTPGGVQNYVITCKKEWLCIEISFDEHKSNLPCWRELK